MTPYSNNKIQAEKVMEVLKPLLDEHAYIYKSNNMNVYRYLCTLSHPVPVIVIRKHIANLLNRIRKYLVYTYILQDVVIPTNRSGYLLKEYIDNTEDFINIQLGIVHVLQSTSYIYGAMTKCKFH
ncbi:hypothetical protein Scep_018556 [Stephania cephalantha]|uniref:Uncharacterized protein n=1 Tax=Stephania cephalantha TaxID=152367 RepID=A0AAP0NK86_9MAGN